MLVISYGLLGHLAAPFNIAKISGVFALSLVTGWAVNSGPRVLQIFRFATVAFLIAAALPEIGLPDIGFILLGATVSFLVSSVTDSQSGFSRRFQVGNLGRETRKLLHSPRRHRRFTLAFGVVAALGLVLGQQLGLSHPYWITVTTIFTMQPETHAAFMRLFQRVAGTFVAVPITLLLLSVAHLPLAMAVSLVVSAFLFPVAFARNYLLASTVIVIFVVIAIGLGYTSHTVALHLLWARMDETLLEAILATIGILITYAGDARARSPAP
ncbi:MAG: FUSC family protein [Acidiferrobacter sp.]